jgi:ABC-2 type transport system ATP-binding protein
MLKASHLRKEFTSVVAVDDVSFEVNEGEILGLLGPNGAGKTTSIRMVLNILRPDGGAISYLGVPFTDETRRDLGYLPEERGLYRKSKVLDTLLYFAELRSMDRRVARARSYNWLERFGLLPDIGRRVEELSKGNQQKLQFIVAVLHNPTLVILDEPFSGLDPINQMLLNDILLELKSQKKAVIFSTHQMDQAERLCDTLCLINQGDVMLEGSVSEVRRRFGKSAVLLEYTGDGSFIPKISGVAQAFLYPNRAEIKLANGLTPQVLLSQLIDRLEIRRFEVVEPSLHSIFLEVVGKEKPNAPGDAL